MCLSSTRCAPLVAVKYFAWDDAKNAKLKADRGIGFEDVVFHMSAATCSTSWNTRTQTVTPVSASSSSGARTTCTWCRSSKTSTRSS